MKKALAILALMSLATLPSLAAIQRIQPQYRIGTATPINNAGGRITLLPEETTGLGYATSGGSPCVLTIANIPAGQEFKKWWYYYYTGNLATVTNTTALGSALTCQWTYNSNIAPWSPKPYIYIVADYDYITYTLNYNGNGSTSGSMSSTTQCYTNAFKLTANAFAKTGYTFSGWTNSVVTSALANRATVTGKTFKVTYTNKAATLYAKWTANKYTVTLNRQNGSGGSASATATYGAAMPSITTPTRAGYTFGGYFSGTNGSGTQYYTAAGASARNWNVASNTTLYAKWTANKYEYRFNNYFSFYTWAGSSSAALNSSSGGETLSVDKDAGAITISAGTKRHIYTKYSKSASEYSSFYKISISEASATAGTQRTFSCKLSGTSTKCEVYYVEYDANHEIILNGSSQYHGLGGVAASTGEYVKTFVVSPSCRAIQFFFDNHAANTTATWSDIWMHSTSTYDRGVPTPIRRILTYSDNQTVGSLPTGVSRPGYTFSWLCSVNGTATVVTPSTTMASLGVGNKSIYAGNWVANTYTVTLDRQNGTGGSASATATYGAAMPSITKPTRAGYTFGGYFSGTNGSGTQYYTAEGMGVATWDKTSATTLYAKWTENAYTVTFNANGGSVTPSSKTVTYGSVYGELPTPTYSGGSYTFGGWWTATSGGTQITNESTVSITSDQTLYAQWLPDRFTVAFYDSQFFGGGLIASNDYFYGDELYVPSCPVHAGYTPSGSGWSPAVPSDYRVHGSENYFATYTANAYAVVFDANGGTGTMNSQVLTYDADLQGLSSNRFSRVGYTFTGWAEHADGSGRTFVDGEQVKNLSTGGNYTLYAIWTPLRYYIAFDGQGADDGETMDTMVLEGNVTTNLTDCAFAKTGYTFDGWATNETAAAALAPTYTNCAEVVSVELGAPQGETNVLYAVWLTNTYTVVFNANGGTGEMAPQAFVYDQPLPLSKCTYSSNLKFSGWATNQTGDVVFEDEATVSNLTAVASGEVTLYAVWDNGELSKAMHCGNLVWVQEGEVNARTTWEVAIGGGEGYEASGSSVSNLLGWTVNKYASYTLKPASTTSGSGRLSFYYKTSSNDQWNRFYFNNEKIASSTTWQKYGPVNVEDITTVSIQFAADLNYGEKNYTVWIDQMTWEPDGAEPTEEDKPTISAFAATADGFTLSASNVSESFNYQILATNELVGGDWPVMTNLTSDVIGSGFTIVPEADEPTMFYKVKVIAK